ncbi:hypothetical protein HMPREF3182_01561 [Megasphaera hutchinsoni]|uniref:Uncharacterized protein n=1 Tax=Megasphaera hutchinsoni TaxID=1588748 RepID=A0A134CDA8_9FIRM|nr:hypothetical protein HMPREF3182_01561 [Megasphaera hutchinsoni]
MIEIPDYKSKSVPAVPLRTAKNHRNPLGIAVVFLMYRRKVNVSYFVFCAA